jgi:thiol-disulfide isomerase/thioredoxin/phage gp36-like protein
LLPYPIFVYFSFSNQKNMKKYLIVICILIIASCKEEPKDYVTFSGQIANQNSDSIVISTRTFKKVIKVNPDGSFSDTLKVEKGTYSFYDGGESSTLFLENGYDLTMTLDAEMFDETIKYAGKGAINNNFLAEKALLEEKLLDKDFESMDEAGLDLAFDDAEKQITAYINSNKEIDSMVVNKSLKDLNATLKSYKGYYGSILDLRKALPKGSPSPVFVDYENYDGSKTSLSDLKGKYVYVDIWATWCGPCKREIPFLKEIEKEYHDKNIVFVSMSIDDDRTHNGSWEQANANWRAMVAEKELGGIQIFAPKGWQSDFVTGYMINGIPRFVLIDPDGNVVDASAPRPSSEKLRPLLDSLLEPSA